MTLFGTIYDLLLGIIPGVLFIKNLPYQRRRDNSPDPDYSGLDHSKSDEELIQDFKKDHEKYIIGVLFDRYIHVVFASCMKYYKNEDDAQDAAMEILQLRV